MKAGTGIAWLALLVSACSVDLLGSSGDIYKGLYSFGFETSAFRACNSSEVWWVSGDLRAVNEVIAALPPASDGGPRRSGTLYVEWRGEPSRRGEYGHLGGYPREFEVEATLVARPTGADDCR